VVANATSAAQPCHMLEHTRHFLDHVVLVGGVFVFATVEVAVEISVVDPVGDGPSAMGIGALGVGGAGDAGIESDVVIPIVDIRPNEQLRMWEGN
jgi:hypothetical protein